MQIIFVVAPRYWKQDWLGIMCLSSVLKKNDFEVKVLPAEPQPVLDAVANGRPSVLAYSAPSFLASQYLDFNRRIRSEIKGKVWSVFGGPHPTYYPEMVEVEGVDAVCRGEGEDSALEFFSLLREGQSPLECLNWYVKDEAGVVHENGLRPLIQDLDKLPFPDRSLFKLGRTQPAAFMVGRGCPYTCTYCFNRAYNKLYGLKKPLIRRRSVDNVVEELARVKDEHDAFVLQSVDDVFCHPPFDWIDEFAEKYPSRVGIPLGGNVRANLINERVVNALKRACFCGVAMGVEAGNEDVRRNALKRYMTNDSIVNAGRLLKEAGMMLTTYNIIGIPGGSFEADLDTVRINKAIRPTHALCFVLGPYQGTEIFDMATALGMVGDDYVDQLKDGSKNPYGWHPKLKYKTEQEARRIENLYLLFSPAIFVPLLVRCVPWLADRSWGWLYALVNKGFRHAIHLRQRVGIISAAFRCDGKRAFRLLFGRR